VGEKKLLAVLSRASEEPGMTIAVLGRMVCMMNHPKQREPCPPGAHEEYVSRLLRGNEVAIPEAQEADRG
jgi:hypothetical protein